MQDWAEALLDEQRLRQAGWLDPGPIRTLWSRYLSAGGIDSTTCGMRCYSCRGSRKTRRQMVGLTPLCFDKMWMNS